MRIARNHGKRVVCGRFSKVTGGYDTLSQSMEDCGRFGDIGGRLESSKGMGLVSGTSVIIALLQSLCTAVLTVNSVRVGIGLAALAATSIAAPLVPLHKDSIRIPMLIVAVAGAVINLAVLAWVRHLRNRPEAQWRRRELSRKQRLSEQLQIVMAILTLVLVGLEVWTHAVLHRPPHTPASTVTRSA